MLVKSDNPTLIELFKVCVALAYYKPGNEDMDLGGYEFKLIPRKSGKKYTDKLGTLTFNNGTMDVTIDIESSSDILNGLPENTYGENIARVCLFIDSFNTVLPKPELILESLGLSITRLENIYDLFNYFFHEDPNNVKTVFLRGANIMTFLVRENIKSLTRRNSILLLKYTYPLIDDPVNVSMYQNLPNVFRPEIKDKINSKDKLKCYVKERLDTHYIPLLTLDYVKPVKRLNKWMYE